MRFTDLSEEGITSLKQAVRAAALSKVSRLVHASPEQPVTSAEHYFTPIAAAAAGPRSIEDAYFQTGYHPSGALAEQANNLPTAQGGLRSGLGEGNGSVSRDPSLNQQWTGDLERSNLAMPLLVESPLEDRRMDKSSEGRSGGPGGLGPPASPPLLMELSAFGDTYDDLLGVHKLPLSFRFAEFLSQCMWMT